MSRRYYVIPQSLDGCDLPTTPEPMELRNVGAHIDRWLRTFELKGQPYFSNCRQEHIPLDELEFKLAPHEDGGQS